MNYRSLADMNDALLSNLHRLPRDIDLVVGIPRSGILAAGLFSLITNIPMTDLDSFLEGRIYTSGVTKRWLGLDRPRTEMRRILVLDDSILGGGAMRSARDRLNQGGVSGEFIMAAVYGAKQRHNEVDFVFEVVPPPRVFQWNLMHHAILEDSCVDIDGVLCRDPTPMENDDGQAYRKFLLETTPLHVPTRRIGRLVTSRLEKYREPTEDWLSQQGIEYGELTMLDLPSKEERQRQGAHATFKGDVYRKAKATFFIESEPAQAETIARISGKPVLCIETHQVFMPEALSIVTLQQKFRNLPARFRKIAPKGHWMKSVARRLLGESGYRAIKNRFRPRSNE